MKKLIINILLLIAFSIKAWSAINPKDHHPSPKVQQFINHKDWNFVENKGQVQSSDIKYYGHQEGVYLYCKPGMLSFVFTKTEKATEQISEATGTFDDGVGVQNPEPLHGKQPFDRSPLSALRSSISTSRTDLVLLNSNHDARIIATDKQEYYENFFLANTPDEGITMVHTYKIITYKSIYPNIDMVLNCREQGMEYSFIVHPGGKVSDIRMQWNGTEASKAFTNGGFKFRNSLGSLEESAPKSFAGGKEIQTNLIHEVGENRFSVGYYNPKETLIIDPTIIWSTYYGGIVSDCGLGIAVDKSGSIFVTGYTSSSSKIASSGAYQSSFAANTLTDQAYLAKFSSTGKRLWGTYFGGSRNNFGSGVTIDPSGNAIITGCTSSTDGIASSGAWQVNYGGGYHDAFIAKFNTSGNRIWSTYYGGSNDENFENTYNLQTFGNITTDASGNIFITGFSGGGTGIASAGAYQTDIYGGNSDAFVAKFSPNGQRIWGTYFGGDGDDLGAGITLDDSNNVYISGLTSSKYYGIASSGAYESTFGKGGFDAFIAKFSSSGDRIWSTYFGGSNNAYSTVGEKIVYDHSGNFYLTGWTGADSGIATAGTYRSVLYNGHGGAFVEKFTTSGKRIWGTYFGGESDQDPYDIACDGFGNVFICGYTQSSTHIAQNNDSTLPSNGFFAQFSNSGALKYSNYFLKGRNTTPMALTIDQVGNLYLTGFTDSDTGVATSGAWQTNNEGYTDAVITKFSYKSYQNDAGIVSILAPGMNFCSGTQAVQLSLENFGIKELDSIKIGWSVNNINQKTYYWTGKLIQSNSTSVNLGSYLFPPGIYNIKVWTMKPNGLIDSVAQNDTASIVIKPMPLPDPGWYTKMIGNATYFHAVDSSYQNASYKWKFGDGDSSTGHVAIHSYTASKNYSVSLKLVNSNNCRNEMDSTINVDITGISPDLSNSQSGLNIYPNPFQSTATLTYNLKQNSKISVIIFDITGKQICINIYKSQTPGSYQFDINAEKYHLNPGVYLLKFIVNDEVESRRLVKF